MKNLLRSTISSYFYCLSFFKRREGIIVLMYHRINDQLPPDELIVPVKKFQEQMEYLKEHYDVLGPSELLNHLNNNVNNHEPTRPKIFVTFDDGYRDNYIYAYPILKKLGLPATIFLISGMINTHQKRPRYQHMPNPDMMAWDEARQMNKDNITFAGHTHSHPRLSDLDYLKQKNEIKESIDIVYSNITDETAKKIFCYPYGDYNDDTLKIMKELEIEVAFSVKPGINNGQVSPFELKRTLINGKDSLFDFKKKLAGAFDWMHEQIQKKKAKKIIVYS